MMDCIAQLVRAIFESESRSSTQEKLFRRSLRFSNSASMTTQDAMRQYTFEKY